MKWSFAVARVSGIEIRIHVTFLLIVAWFAYGGLRHGLVGAAVGALIALLLFTCVTLHELGHSLVAQRFGIPVQEIVLLPIGGVARLGRSPSTPWQEFAIAIAGPLVNVVIAVLLGVLGGAVWGRAFFETHVLASAAVEARPTVPSVVALLMVANVALALFNMIPALPMDGGRVLRAILAALTDRTRATRWAATLGQAIAVGFGVIGIATHNLALSLIGVFVFLAAGQEKHSSESTSVLASFAAHEVVDPAEEPLHPGDTLGDAIDRMLRSPRTDFPVTHGDRLLGTLGRNDALLAASRVGLHAYVGQVMRQDLLIVPPEMPLDRVRDRLAEGDGRPVAVVGPQGFLGLLTFDDLGRIAMMTSLLSRVGIQRHPAVPARGASHDDLG